MADEDRDGAGIDPAVAGFMEQRGFDMGSVSTEVLDADVNNISKYYVVVSLQGPVKSFIPEIPFQLDSICDFVESRRVRGRGYSIVVCAEGARPADGEQVVAQLAQFLDFADSQIFSARVGHGLGNESAGEARGV